VFRTPPIVWRDVTPNVTLGEEGPLPGTTRACERHPGASREREGFQGDVTFTVGTEVHVAMPSAVADDQHPIEPGVRDRFIVTEPKGLAAVVTLRFGGSPRWRCTARTAAAHVWTGGLRVGELPSIVAASDQGPEELTAVMRCCITDRAVRLVEVLSAWR